MVLVLSDGVPGHDRSSQGVVAALAHGRTVETAWLGIREVRPRSRRLARVAAALADPRQWLASSTRLAPPADVRRDGYLADWPAHADVVVSTGPSTAAANVAAARRYRARNIYCGFPKTPVLGYALILSPVPSRARHVALAPRPSDIDADRLASPRALDPSAERRIAVLVGGESKHYRYSTADMTELAAAARRILAAAPGWRVDVYDSRRTRADTFEAFLAAAPSDGRLAVHRFVEGGLGSNRAAYEADAVVVTADSLSMITEAIAAGRPTVVARAAHYRGPARDRREIAALLRAGRVIEATFRCLDAATLRAAPAPPRLSHVAALSRLLAERGF